jgi:hypothetical protein
MANSFVRYTGNGATTTYAIPFSYRSVDDLSATVNGTVVTTYTLDGAGTNLTFNVAPVNGAAIEIRRTTSQNTKLVDYVSGSVLTENDLDTDSDQAFYMSQEAIDKAGDVISLDNADFNWDVQNKRLKNVAAPVADTDAVNKAFITTNLPNINTVAGIAADVTTVAGISGNVTTVATNDANITTVATNIASVNTVATDIAKVIAVADDLAEAVSEVETVANDLNEATSEIEVVANSITNVDTVGTNIANVNTVAGISGNVTTVAGISSDVTGVAGISTAVTNVNSNSTNINAVNANSANINTVAGINADVTTVSGISADVTSVAGVSANVTTVAGISADVTAVAGDATDIGTVATDLAGSNNVGTVSGSIANVNSVGGSIASVNTVATNIADVNSFANTYRIAASAPVTSLDVGDLYFDTTANELKVYKASGWSAAGSTVNGTSARFTYNITGTPSSVSGADANGNTLAYDAGFADVYVNGVRMSSSDITITSGTSVVFATALSDGDVVDVVAYGTFNVAAIDASNITSGTLNSNRLPTVPTTKGGTGLTTIGSAGQALKVNSGGTALEFGDVSVSLSYTKGTFTGDNSTTAFTIDSGRAVDDVLVYVNGFLLTPTSDYTISGTTLTFTTAPATSAEIVVRYLPLNNSGVYTNDTATGDNSTTAFTIDSGRTVEDVIVTVNGVTLVPATDYTISGTTLTFTTAPTTSAEISIRYLRLT